MMSSPPVPTPSRLESLARRRLQNDLLYERAGRIVVLARWIAGFRELAGVACNRRAVEAAAWLQDAWWAAADDDERPPAAILLTEPPTPSQREQAADVADRILAGEVDDATRATAAAAIRQASSRETTLPEAQILAEASSLDSFGPMWLLGQAARCAAENRPVASLIAVWERQVEYGYWPKRIAETLRFSRSRELARLRCADIETFMLSLRRQLDAGDRHQAPEMTP
jgi:hypothetical protein